MLGGYITPAFYPRVGHGLDPSICGLDWIGSAKMDPCPTRGRFRHVQHVRPNRGPHKKGTPSGQRLSDASTTFSGLWGWAYLYHIATFKT